MPQTFRMSPMGMRIEENIIEICGRFSFRNFSNPVTHSYRFNFGHVLIPSNRIFIIISQRNRDINWL